MSDSIFSHKISCLFQERAGDNSAHCRLLLSIKAPRTKLSLIYPSPRTAKCPSQSHNRIGVLHKLHFKLVKGGEAEASSNISYIPSWIGHLQSCNFDELWNSDGGRNDGKWVFKCVGWACTYQLTEKNISDLICTHLRNYLFSPNCCWNKDPNLRTADDNC